MLHLHFFSLFLFSYCGFCLGMPVDKTLSRILLLFILSQGNTQSGNSFNNLIPFSKYPYKDCDYGNQDMLESVKEEKRRKQMEAIAEDLFNTEKARRRGVAGSLHGLLTRG
ncbi:hypothetical protein NC651_033043 [Populus alba x Populus x berolinensis]|nr:hypothetical protein NC651_033043 [Populus alba x Populus x berolinensis]